MVAFMEFLSAGMVMSCVTSDTPSGRFFNSISTGPVMFSRLIEMVISSVRSGVMLCSPGLVTDSFRAAWGRLGSVLGAELVPFSHPIANRVPTLNKRKASFFIALLLPRKCPGVVGAGRFPRAFRNAVEPVAQALNRLGDGAIVVQFQCPSPTNERETGSARPGRRVFALC